MKVKLTMNTQALAAILKAHPKMGWDTEYFQSDDEVEVTVFPGEQEELLQIVEEVVTQFETAYPNCKVVYEVEKFGEEMFDVGPMSIEELDKADTFASIVKQEVGDDVEFVKNNDGSTTLVTFPGDFESMIEALNSAKSHFEESGFGKVIFEYDEENETVGQFAFK